MSELRKLRSGASVALAITLVTAPLAAAQAQPAASSDAVRTRVLAWPGGERLFVATNADVRYVQGANAKVVVTGPADEIDDLVVQDGVIRHDERNVERDWRWWKWRWRNWGHAQAVHIVVTAPHVSEAGILGSGHLDLGRLAQDRLDARISGSGGLDVSGQFKSLSVGISGSGGARLTQVSVGDMSARLSGSGWVTGGGAANSLHLTISGSGGADLGGLAVQDAQASVFGSGSARISPKREANIDVFGSGAVRLLTEPARLNAHRAGSGAIIHPGGVS
jgi:hypothetical protein